MKILIENAVPLNNGDAALIFAVGNKFKERSYQVVYSTYNSKIVKKKYPNEKWIKSPLESRIIRLPLIGFILLFLKVFFSKKHREFNAIVAAPGGYINSYYGFKRKLQLMVMYKLLLNKKIYIYSQSIGPLNKHDQRILKKYIKYFEFIFVRDNKSKENMDQLGAYENVIQTKDAAFLLNPIPKGNTKGNKIAISVREWKHDSRSVEKYINLIRTIVNFLVKQGYEITFLSTCQGEPDYTNDAIMANKIYSTLNQNIKEQVTIDSNYYNLSQLREELRGFKFVIGTRLHMCILSWLSNTPAFNISYEDKGKECYSYLGLENYSIDYNFQDDIEEKISSFLHLDNGELLKIYNKIIETNSESKNFFNLIYNDIDK